MTTRKYKHLFIDNFAGEPTPEEIQAIERSLRASLPSDFVNFLHAANGGDVEYSVDVSHPEGVQVMSFCGIYSTKADENGSYGYETFLYEISEERQYKRIPNQILPFARDGGSDVVYLDLTPEGAGRVVAYIHGLPAWTGLAQEDAFVEIATSFTEYLDRLYIPSADALDIVEDALKQKDPDRLQNLRDWLDTGMPDWRNKLGIDF